MRTVCASLGAFPGRTVREAMEEAKRASEPLLGPISVEEVQLCPQNRGTLTVEVAAALRREFPGTRFRLHANARVAGWTPFADASRLDRYPEYFQELWAVSMALAAPAFTWHAGGRDSADLQTVLWRTREVEDALGIPVGIEGMYPTPGDRYLLSTWAEYEELLSSGARYALDLSHIHIVAAREGRDDRLLTRLLECDRCLEIHLSGNDGTADQHAQLATTPWWWELLEKHAHPGAAVFTEGNQARARFV